MKTINNFKILISIIILLYSLVAQGQDFKSSREWVGIWDYKLNFYRVQEVDTNEFTKGSFDLLDVSRVCVLTHIIKKKYIWYILITNDYKEIIRTDSLLRKIKLDDPEKKWRYEYNSYLQFSKNSQLPPEPEFLPNGHWLYFSTEKDKVGISKEKYVRNYQIDKFSKTYDFKPNFPIEYFEVKDGLLNGIVYFTYGSQNAVKAISRYKDGELVERLYGRNDPDNVCDTLHR